MIGTCTASSGAKNFGDKTANVWSDLTGQQSYKRTMHPATD